MSYHDYEPIDPRDAFTITPRPGIEETESAAASQAALLLSARAGVLGMAEKDQPWIREAADEGFEIPDLRPLERSRRLRVEEATRPLELSAKELAEEEAPPQDEMARAARRLYESPSTEVAAALFEASMHSPHPLVRVAAAAGARETTRLRKQIRRTLEAGCESDDRLVARLAQQALSKIDPSDPHVGSRVIPQPASKRRRRRSDTAVITHGTFAADAGWYQPHGDFYQALDQHRHDLALHDQSFTWTGAYSPTARRADAALLEQWLDDQGLNRPDFFAHSHGGTVAHLATRRGVEFNRLVLMAWPVHERWLPDPGRVGQIIDIRVRVDLVILLDGGGQRFDANQVGVTEHRHGWFDHSAPHQPAYWDRYQLWDDA